jgi:hypothetical protein
MALKKAECTILTSQPDMLGLLQLRAAPSAPESSWHQGKLTWTQKQNEVLTKVCADQFPTMKVWNRTKAIGTAFGLARVGYAKPRAQSFTTSVKTPAATPKARTQYHSIQSKFSINTSSIHGSADMPNGIVKQMARHSGNNSIQKTPLIV